MTQDEAFEILKTGRNTFVTGPAGSGKTHLINRYIAYLREHDIDMGITAYQSKLPGEWPGGIAPDAKINIQNLRLLGGAAHLPV